MQRKPWGNQRMVGSYQLPCEVLNILHNTKQGKLHKNENWNGKDLHGDNLKSALTSLFGEYSTDTVTRKLVPAANSQCN